MSPTIFDALMMNRVSLLVVFLATSTLLAVGTARAATEGIFKDVDPSEGLEMQGNFIYAVNAGPPRSAGKAGDANFTDHNTSQLRP